jgi:D-alanine-D-alanine ligase
MGENGQLQATLDNYGISYSGSGYIGSLLAMDKDLSKRLLRSADIATPDWIYAKADSLTPDEIEAKIGIPCVIKPCSCGSSVGITIAESKDELADALSLASQYEGYILAEKKITGREFTMAILDGVTLPPVEIIPKSGFYDYKNKYQKGATVEICPAPITDEEFAKMSDVTRRGFETLRLDGYARFDYIMDEEGEIFCLEANTLPGMTPTSLMPQEANAVGIDYDSLGEKIANIALNKKVK